MFRQQPGRSPVLRSSLRPPDPRSRPSPNPRLALRRAGRAPSLRPRKSLGSAEGAPWPLRDARCESCLDPGRPRSRAVRTRGGSYLGAPAALLPAGAGAPVAGGLAVDWRLQEPRLAAATTSFCAKPWASPAACSQFWPRLGAQVAGLGLVSRPHVLCRRRAA